MYILLVCGTFQFDVDLSKLEILEEDDEKEILDLQS